MKENPLFLLLWNSLWSVGVAKRILIEVSQFIRIQSREVARNFKYEIDYWWNSLGILRLQLPRNEHFQFQHN